MNTYIYTASTLDIFSINNSTFSNISRSSMHRLVSHSKQRSINKFAVTVRIVISGSISTCCVYGTTIRSISSSSYLDLSNVYIEYTYIYKCVHALTYKFICTNEKITVIALLNRKIFIIPININNIS